MIGDVLQLVHSVTLLSHVECVREPRFVAGPAGWDTCSVVTVVAERKQGEIPEKQRPRPRVRSQEQVDS